ncbi:uncharacterized protein LOC123514298 [Portunus trituberculatus]|uniref:uncharacterized protein LOC123514298 n=1 Tax=Portunus trituberculatus TaxID=210409 RepID=UPI001E1D1CC2|nr:uncharacterized protein LOC123514298 [Portunus trituberculatus]
MKFKIGFLASLPLTTDTELVTTTVKFQPRGERLERVGGGRDRDQYRACLQTVADETGQEEDPRDRHCLLPHPANTRVNAALQCYKSHAVVDGDCSAPRGRSSSTSSSESSNTNTSDSISFNSTNSSGSTASTGNSLASSSVHNSDSTNVQTSKRPGKTFFTFSPRNDSRKRRIGTGTNSPAGVALTTTTTTTACLEFSVNGKANIGNNVTKGVKLKTNSLSSNSSYESQTSSNSSNKSFRKFFHRGNVFSNSFKMRNSIKKSAKSSDKSTRKSTTAKATTINNSSSITNSINSNIEENSRFLLPADSVTNIVVVGDKGVGKSAITVRFLTRRYIGEYSSDSEMMYQHDTTVDHAPACLQLLDVTTLQTPYQILNHLSWAHAFVVVYDITSRTSFIHARQLLHILHSRFHTNPSFSKNLPPQPSSYKTSDCATHTNISHEIIVPACSRNDRTTNGDCVLSEQPMLPITSVASRPPQPPHSLTSTNHHAHQCYQADPSPTGQRYSIQSSLPISSHGRQEPATLISYQYQRPDANRLRHATTPYYGFSRSTTGDTPLIHCRCHCHNLHTKLPCGTTLDNYDSKYSKSSFIPSHVYYDSIDTLVEDHPRYNYNRGTRWSPTDKVRRIPLGYHTSFDLCDEGQKPECYFERSTSGCNLHHSCNRHLPEHAASRYQECLPSKGGCSSTGPLQRHTTLLLGNKRDLEHIRRVWTDEGEALSLEFSCQFYEVSAAESVLGVHLAFHSLLKETRALQLIKSLPYGNSQDSSKGTVSSAVSKVIGNFFRVGKVGHKRQSNSI